MQTNEAGVVPVETKVVVKLLPVENKVGSLIVPEDVRERQQMAQIDAEIIAVGPMAFSDGLDADGNVRYWPAPIPKPGDRVKISRYSGQSANGESLKAPTGDEPVYRIINDKDVAAICI